MNVTLADVLSGAAAHAVSLTAECAGYLVLAAADQAVLAPRRMLGADLELGPDGGVRVAHSRGCEESDAERDLRALLDELLLAASSVTPSLLRAGRRPSGGSIASFLREIETALIPVNRAAARRALARLQRETVRALENNRFTREQRPETPRFAQSRLSSPLPPSVELALSAIPTPGPTPPAPLRAPSVPPPAVRTMPSAARSMPPTVPNDPVPPPTPRPLARLAAELVVLPSLTPPPPVTSPEVETRPEPVVVRASQRPSAPTPAPALAAPAVSAKAGTPLLGTVVAVRPVAAATERRDTLPAAAPFTPLAPAASEFGGLLEAYERTELLDDIELVYLDAEPAPTDFADHTERCPPVAEEEEDELEIVDAASPFEEAPRDEEPIPTPLVLTERLALPIVPLVSRKIAAAAAAESAPVDEPPLLAETPFAEPVALLEPVALALLEPEPPLITEPEPSPIAELARLAYAEVLAEPEPIAELEPELISEVELAVLIEGRSELPSWAASPAETPELTPPPRHALPRAQPSDVEDLLGRLGDAPLAVDELRNGLKHLAGLELTPSPHVVRPSE